MTFVQQWTEDGDIASAESYSFDISTGGGPTADNLLIAIIAIDKGAATSVAATGFTKIDDYGGVDVDAPTCAIFWKKASGSETSVEFSWTDADDPHAWCGEYSGMDTTTPVDVKADYEEGGAVTQVPNGSDASITTTVAATMLFAAVHADSKSSWDTGTHSWTGTDIDTTRFAGYTGGTGEPQVIIGEGNKTATGTYTTRGNTSDTGDEAVIWFGAFKPLSNTRQSDFAWFDEDDLEQPHFDTGTLPVIESGDITSDSNNTADTTPDVDVPASADGDLLIAFLCHDDDQAGNVLTLPTAGSFSEALAFTSGPHDTGEGQGPSAGCVAWISTATRAASQLVWAIASSGEQWASRVVLIPAGEFDPNTPIDSSGVNSASSGTNVASPAITAVNAGGKVLVFCGTDIDPMTDASASGWDAILANTDHGNNAAAVITRTGATTAAESISATTVATIGGDSWITFGVVVNAPLVADGRTLRGSINTTSDLTTDTDYGLSIRVENTGSAEASVTSYKLQHNYNSTGYIDTTTSSAYVNIQASGDYADGDDCFEYLGKAASGPGTFITDNNAILETDGTLTLTAVMGASSAFELHTTIQITSDDVSDGNTILFKVVESDGTALDAITNEGTCTINEPGGGGTQAPHPFSGPLQRMFGGPF